jgi:dipeptidyl aminopeptidase/acylaminoacyl peptidase
VPDRSRTETPIIAPYGSWASPFSVDMLTGQTVPLKEPGVDSEAVYWLEGRPNEGGRSTLIRLDGDTRTELTPAPFDVRSRAHEYGGGSWTAADGTVVFSHGKDNRLYRISPSQPEPSPITPESAYRYADILIDTHHGRIIAVREDHSLEGAEPVNTIVQLELDGPNEDGGQMIISGSDFVASPALSPDGTQLAWLMWNHPQMPWDGTELWYADVRTDGALQNIRLVTGGTDESIVRPRWNETGLPVFVSDRTGWWNLYADRPHGIVPLRAMEADFAQPQWVFGMSTWDFLANGSVICAWSQNGVWHLGRLDVEDGPLRRYDLPFTAISDVHVQQSTDTVIFLGASPTDPGGVVRLDANTGEWDFLRKASEEEIDPDTVSIAHPVSWTSTDGETAHGFYYPPVNPLYTGPEGELPPLIVESHGGPTSFSSSAFSMKRQFWTSRGFAILDVNYGGSTGYGRAYRDRLKGKWGIVDVEDCVTGAEMLANQKLVDPARLIIRGGSAGGFTTLAALTSHGTFQVGTSLYGIGDLEAMARETHKFESRYLDGLVGPYPEEKQTYIDRSPIHHVDRLDSAMILLQGLEDKVVPPNQATMMAEAVRANGMPVAHVEFEGEGHGFRSAEAIRQATEAELSFYAQVLGFTPADDIPVVPVDNL